MGKMVKERRGNTGLRLIVCAAAMGLVLGLGAQGEGASYTYTKIADTSGPFLRFGFASINGGGAVTFSAALDDTDGDGRPDGSGVFTSDGTTTTTIADSNGAFNIFFGPPSVTDLGAVAFRASLDTGQSGIYTSDGTTTTTIADTSGAFSSFDSPSISSNGGTVAFQAFLDVGGAGVFTGSGGPTTTIVSTSGVFRALGFPSITTGGRVAFRGVLDVGGSGVFTSDGATTATIADTSGAFSSFSFPFVNDGGVVTFFAGLDAGGNGIFTSDGTTTTSIAVSGGAFTLFSTSSITSGGAVAFQAFWNGGNGIFTGPDPVADKVIVTGDPLSGSSVIGLVFAREGLNDAGQVTFVAILADGTQGVYRADPEAAPLPPPDPVPLPDPIPSPDPDPLSVTIDIKPGNEQNNINLGSKGVLQVAILSTDTFNAATVDPKSIRLSGAYVKEKGNGTLMAWYRDANADGLVDLVVHVETESINLDASATEAVLEAMTFGGAAISGTATGGTTVSGSDSVRIIP